MVRSILCVLSPKTRKIIKGGTRPRPFWAKLTNRIGQRLLTARLILGTKAARPVILDCLCTLRITCGSLEQAAAYIDSEPRNCLQLQAWKDALFQSHVALRHLQVNLDNIKALTKGTPLKVDTRAITCLRTPLGRAGRLMPIPSSIPCSREEALLVPCQCTMCVDRCIWHDVA